MNELYSLVKAGHPILAHCTIDADDALKVSLSKGIRTDSFGDMNEQRRVIRQDFNDGAYDVLIGSSIFDTAVDLHRASGLVLAASGSSRVTSPQRVGRVLSQVMGKVAFGEGIRNTQHSVFQDSH